VGFTADWIITAILILRNRAVPDPQILPVLYCSYRVRYLVGAW
jgi:hypothetical protein